MARTTRRVIDAQRLPRTVTSMTTHSAPNRTTTLHATIARLESLGLDELRELVEAVASTSLSLSPVVTPPLARRAAGPDGAEASASSSGALANSPRVSTRVSSRRRTNRSGQ